MVQTLFFLKGCPRPEPWPKGGTWRCVSLGPNINFLNTSNPTEVYLNGSECLLDCKNPNILSSLNKVKPRLFSKEERLINNKADEQC